MVRNTQNSGTLCFARQALPGGQQAGAKGSQCGGGPAGGAGLGQGGTTSWMAGVLASLGSLLLACGWFFTRKQVFPKH